MAVTIINKLRQLQNVLLRDISTGRSKTLTLMPKGCPQDQKTISEYELTDDVRGKQAKGYLAIKVIKEE